MERRKNGKSFFLLKTKHSLFMECMFVKKEVIRNNAGIDEDWYWLNVDASNISIPAYRKNSPLCIKGISTPEIQVHGIL